MAEKRLSLLERIERLIFLINPVYDWLQKNEIILGQDKGLSVKSYKNNDFNWMQMREIRLGLENDVNISHYAKPNLSVEQMEEIRIGLEKDLDVTYFNDNTFDWMQMREIRLGQEKNLDISHYAKSNLSVEQMEEIRIGLEKDLDVTYFNDNTFDWMQMREIRRGLEKGLDISFYDDPSFNWGQMREIRLGLEQEVNIFKYLDPKIKKENMRKIRLEELKENFNNPAPVAESNKTKQTNLNQDSSRLKDSTNIQKDNKTLKQPTEEKTQQTSKESIKETPREEIKLTKYDINYIFPLIKRYKTIESLQEGIMNEYTNPKYAKETLNMIDKRVARLINDGHVDLVEGEYNITQKGIEASKTVNQEFEFTSYDANKVFGYILNAGGNLSLDNLNKQLNKEYTDIKQAEKQYNYLKNRLENNASNGYLNKHEDNSYSISKEGIDKAKELSNESHIEEIETELEI